MSSPVLVFGKTGQVASELQVLKPEATYLGRDKADLSDPAACQAAIRALRPSAVINAAAYTAVDRAEEDVVMATVVNGDAPGAMAQACAELDIPFVHISTDYVFDGTGQGAFAPDHSTGPLGVYGASKLAGETNVIAAGGRYGILRTSWVFSPYGANFLKTMLRVGAGRDHLTVVADQIGGPTPARGIAQACLAMVDQLAADPHKSGTYHYSGAPDASWADFAREIFEAAGMDVRVEDIPSSAYPTPAARPLNSRLDCSTLLSVFGIERPNWKEATASIVKELLT